jgi:CheY-like chemotaxis protein
MDIHLGEAQNGMEVIILIRKMSNYKDTPIVAMTAYA